MPKSSLYKRVRLDTQPYSIKTREIVKKQKTERLNNCQRRQHSGTTLDPKYQVRRFEFRPLRREREHNKKHFS